MNNNYLKAVEELQIVFFSTIKFLFDRFMALVGLILFLPICFVIAILIKLDSHGPVLFKQMRTGKDGKDITIYKFRTMSENNDVKDFSKQDERTRVGNILRKTSLDEIPQLISILKGDMSFIGPRPWITTYYDNMNEEQRRRHIVRPGLTGLAQVNGRNSLNIFDKINYDLEYIDNYSFKQDIKIIFLTFKTVLKAEEADAGKSSIRSEIDDLKDQNYVELLNIEEVELL